jgi:hypothetical protein
MYQWIDDHFNEGELRGLCADLGIDYDDLPGPAKADKARELVLYCERHGRLDDLKKRCRGLRPNVPWLDSPPKPPKLPKADPLHREPRFPWRYIFIGVGVVIVVLALLVGYIIFKTPIVVDSMDRLTGWAKASDLQSEIDIVLAPGMHDKAAIKVDYDLNQGGYVLITKEIAPGLLSGTQSMRFSYMGTRPNTIELKLFYALNATEKGEVFSYARREIVRTDDWAPFQQIYNAFVCADNCRAPGQKLDPAQVRRLEIAISHQLGGTPGPGRIVLDQIEALK